MRDGKKEKWKKKAKINHSVLVFFPTINLAPLHLETLVLVGAKNSMTGIFIGKKEKWTNKGNDKQEEADSLLHNITSHA